MSAPRLRHTLLISALLIGITLITFWPLLNCGFVNLDDNFYVTQNPRVAAGLTSENVAWAFQNAYYGNWAPLTLLSHMLDVQLFGLRPAGHHATNLFLHTLNVLLLFLVLEQMTARTWPSAVVAALFAVHPAHVESVAWISARKDVLSTFFALLCLLAYVKYVRRKLEIRNPKSETSSQFEIRRETWFVLSLVLFALGLLSKSMVVTLPFLLLLLDFWPLHRFQPSTFNLQPINPTLQHSRTAALRLFLEKLPFFALTILFTIISIRALKAANSLGSLNQLSALDMAANAFFSCLRYIGKMFWPVHLAVFYPRPTLPIWAGAVSAAIIILLSLAVLRFGLRRPYIPVGWFWFLGTLVPVTAIPLGDHSIADRYTYIPFIGLFIVIAWAAADLAANVSRQMPAVKNGARDIPARSKFAYTTAAKGSQAALATQPPASRDVSRSVAKLSAGTGGLSVATAAIILIGICSIISFHQLKYWRTSKDLLEHVIAVSGEGLMVHTDLAAALQEQGDVSGAEEHFRAAVRLQPTNALPRANLIKSLMAQGKTNEVVAQYDEWLQLNPSDAGVRENFGVLLAQLGQFSQAAAQFQQLVDLRPDAQSHYRLALALLLQGKAEDAIVHYQEAIRLKPDWPEPLNDLAWLLATCPRAELRKGRQAVELAERACKLTNSKEARFLGTLDAAYAEAGRFPEAITTAEQAKGLALAAGDQTIAELADQRLKLYRSGLPFHQQ
jgi:tetratricopeptide (TPR) repeat protein